MESSYIIETHFGRLRGEHRGNLLSFRGVPYARAARFEPPRAMPAWAGVRDATKRGPIPPQNPSRLAFITGPQPDQFRQSEDCLVVSVHTPSHEGRRPVMVWFHGGAYLSGGGELPCYDGDKLAIEGDAVVVSVTYRLGVFGYLWSEHKEQLNLGLQDQLAALEWVKTNIERFGGDPEAITAFGQSAGGHSIAAIMGVNRSSQLFNRAIIQSAPLGLKLTEPEAIRFAEVFNRILGSDPLRASVGELLVAQEAAIAEVGSLSSGLAPIVAPGSDSFAGPKLDALIGWTKDDAGPFVALRGQKVDLREGPEPLVDKMTARVFGDPAKAFASASPEIARAYIYRIDWRPLGSPYGAAHCVDLPLLLGDEAAWRDAPMLGEQSWSDVEQLGRRIRAAWIAFARSGDPTTVGGWTWLAYGDGGDDLITRIY